MQDMLDRNKLAMGAIIKMIIPEQKSYFEDALSRSIFSIRKFFLTTASTNWLMCTFRKAAF